LRPFPANTKVLEADRCNVGSFAVDVWKSSEVILQINVPARCVTTVDVDSDQFRQQLGV
jgi:hypothetical protein